MVTRLTNYTKQFWILLYTDDMDTLGSHNGDEAIVIDRNERYVFDEENQTWRQIPMSGGGGGGGEYWVTPQGTPYVKELKLPIYRMGVGRMFANAEHLETVVCNDTRVLGGDSSKTIIDGFRNCTSLKSAVFPFIQGIGSSFVDYFLGDCISLEEAVFGSAGHPISEFANTSYSLTVFSSTTQQSLVITMYVDASSMADIPTAVTAYAPWGATGATIIYRNSATGEVITA